MIRNIDESFNKCVREEVIPNIAKAFGYLEGELMFSHANDETKEQIVERVSRRLKERIDLTICANKEAIVKEMKSQ